MPFTTIRDTDKRKQRPESTSPTWHPHNHTECVGNDCDAVLSGEIIAGRSLLAQFGLTPKSKRGLAASDPGEAVDALDAL